MVQQLNYKCHSSAGLLNEHNRRSNAAQLNIAYAV